MKKMSIKEQKRFCIVAFIWGILFTFLIPLWQVPDEYEHVKMIGQEFDNGNLAEILLKEVPLEEHRVRWNPDERIDVRFLKDAMLKKPEYSIIECIPKGISIKMVRHFPAAFGIFLSVLLRLPAYWVFIWGRLFSLAFYIVLCTISLRLMPLEKELFEIIMLMPMCIQEAASLSYDAVLIPMCFFLISYILYLKFTASKFGLRELFIIMIVVFCIALTKLPYIILGGTLLIVPIQKVHIKIGKYTVTGDTIIKLKWAVCSMVFVSIVVIMYLGRDNVWIQLVEATLAHFGRTVWLFARTCKVWGGDIFASMMGSFGYFAAPTAVWFMALLAAFILVISMTNIKKTNAFAVNLTMKDKVMLYLILGGCFYFVTVSMIPFTVGYGVEDWDKVLYEITEIAGLQGRYYIPMLMLFLLPLPKIFEMEEKVYRKVIIGFYVFSCIYTCGVISVRYWEVGLR